MANVDGTNKTEETDVSLFLSIASLDGGLMERRESVGAIFIISHTSLTLATVLNSDQWVLPWGSKFARKKKNFLVSLYAKLG